MSTGLKSTQQPAATLQVHSGYPREQAQTWTGIWVRHIIASYARLDGVQLRHTPNWTDYKSVLLAARRLLYHANLLALAFTVLAAISLSGCLSRPSLARQYFSLAVPPIAAGSQNHGRVLEIRKIVVAAPFANQTLIYRTGENSYERDYYAEFLVPPAEDLMAPLRGYFRDLGMAATVTSPGSALKPNNVVEITVDELYGDFRNRQQPGAVLTMGFRFFDAPDGVPGKLLLLKHYQQRVRLPARTAAAVVAGWNQALRQILNAVKNDLRSSVPEATPAKAQAKR